MDRIIEPARSIPIAYKSDICVLGGSCTGVCAAVRASRMGATVTIIEKQNSFGGTAASGMVNTWPTLYDFDRKRQINAGMTQEIIDRLQRRDAVIIKPEAPAVYTFNSEELKIELDELIVESKIKPYLHTLYCAPYMQDNELKAVILENKSGRFAIAADYFIDATGDGDLCSHLGLTYTMEDSMQPPTSCVKFTGVNELGADEFKRLIREHGEEYGIKADGWGGSSACVPGISFHAETHVRDLNCADGDMLTLAEIEGRRQIRAMMDIVSKYGPAEHRIYLAALCSCIGIRETRHVHCRYRLTQPDVLYGVMFKDAIANGSRQVDIHHKDKPGMTFKFLDGREVYKSNGTQIDGRWRTDGGETAKFWQIPYRAITTDKIGNVITCGRTIDADPGAYGATRLMVSANQMGEAAGTAAFLALTSGKKLYQIDTDELRFQLKRGGSIVI